MSSKIASLTSAIGGVTTPATDAEAKSKKTEAACRELEGVFVKTLLAQTPMGAKGDTYSGMAVDAVAQAITAGKGLGLGELIRRAIDQAEHGPPKEKTTSAALNGSEN